MALSPSVKVGLIVFIALVALGIVAVFLTDYSLRATGYDIYVVYDDVYGLAPETEVRMAGVKVGKVEEISLNSKQRAVVKIKISQRCKIPDGSQFVLQMGFLIGEAYINIIPNRSTDEFLEDGAVVRGTLPPRLEDILPDAKALIANLNETTDELREVLTDEEYQRRIRRSLENIENATARLDQTMYLLQNTVEGQQNNIDTIVQNVTDASESLRNLMADLEEYERRGDIQANITGALEAARRSAESLERTATSLESVITDPQFQEDIKGTASEAKAAVSEARETVQQAREIVDRIGRVFGVGGRDGDQDDRPSRGLNIDTLIRPADGTFRATASTTLPMSGDSFLRLGIYDLGSSNKIILQPGRATGPQTDLRYGLYASRLGVGLDHKFSSRTSGSLDLFDPEDPRLDLQGAYRLSNDQSLLLGVDGLFKENELTLGVRFTR